MATIKINEHEFEFRGLNARVREHAENVIMQAKEKSEQIKDSSELRPVQIIRSFCKIVSDAFDEVLGEGTSKILFGDEEDMELALPAFAQLTEQVRNYGTNGEVEAAVKKYMPNREQRRAKKK